MKQNLVLKEVLKKKGGKFGFWRKRLVHLTTTNLVVFKNDTATQIERSVEISPTTVVECLDRDKPPRFIVHIQKERPICLAHDNPDVIIRWVNEIRNIEMQTPGVSMDDFDIVSVLGRGFYGKVILVKKKNTEEYYAIKTIHKNRLVRENKVHTIFTERNVMMKARHPFIVNLCFAFQTETKVYLGLEYASGGELFHHLQTRGTFPIDQVRLYVAELSLAINYLHVLKVIYRDLKPENVLLDAQGHIKLTDFGLAKALDDFTNQTGTFCGTSEYIAPEIVSRKPYGPPIDWWALGILTYELLYGQTPFFNQNKARMFHAIKHDKPRFPRKVEQSTVDFILKLLEKDPAKRATFDTIKDHPFFNGMVFEDVLAKKYRPEFIPPSSGISTNFDSEFTMENPLDSLATPAPGAVNAFDGFSYVAGSNEILQESIDDDEEEEDAKDDDSHPQDMIPTALVPSTM